MADTYDFENATNFKTAKILPLKGEKGDAGDSGDYSGLTNKPQINGVTMDGNQTTSDLGIASQASISTVAENVYTKEETISTVVNLIYPVGAIYMSVNDVDPSTFLPDTSWEQIKGQFLLASDDTIYWGRERFPIGSTGGEVSHTLTTGEIPSHTHVTEVPIGDEIVVSTGSGGRAVKAGGSSAPGFISSSVGSGLAHNNMPPYLVVNIWKRIA